MPTIEAPFRPYWPASAPGTEFPQMPGGADADVAILGGGIVGITLAERLQREGLRVVVVEAQRIGAQVTGRSTAKLTALHGLVYGDLIEKHGEPAARAYAGVNQAALGYVAERVEALAIDCSLETVSAYTFSESEAGTEPIRREVEAARRAGLDAEYLDSAPLPFPIAGAIHLAQQYQFHPQRYLVALANALQSQGGVVFERTRALTVEEGNPSRVLTDRGLVTAREIVVATNLPFLDRGLFFAKAFPRAHVALAARMPEERAPGGMFLSVDDPSYSVRQYREGEQHVLIAVGEGFRPGHADMAERYVRLEREMRERFAIDEVLGWWSNEDYDSMDRLPYIGRLTPQSRHTYVATGFSAWGLSNGTAAAAILAESILGRRHPHAGIFDSTRWNLRSAGKRFARTNLHVAREFVADRLDAVRARRADDLATGEGGLVRHHGRISAAYRDENGQLHAFSPNCTHMRCLVAWNREEQTWDCPCHGSRFDREGRVIHGPAVRDLPRRE